MKFNKTLLLTLLALPITACATNDGLLSNYGSNRPAWLNKLQQLNHTSDGKFRIIQVGDSHTAGDYFTDRLRRRCNKNGVTAASVGFIPTLSKASVWLPSVTTVAVGTPSAAANHTAIFLSAGLKRVPMAAALP